MGFVRLLIILGFAGFLIHWWGERQAVPDATAGTSSEGSSASGFIPAAMPDGAPPNAVVILAPLHCSSDEAQRADSLAGELQRLRIPVLRSSQYSATSDGSDSTRQADVKRAVTVLNGQVPAVFVNGRAKANPSADEVIAEYQRAR
jgi:hypothetical protein